MRMIKVLPNKIGYDNRSSQFNKEVDTMLPQIWSNTGSLLSPSRDNFIERILYGYPAFEKNIESIWTPRVDVNETEKAILIDVELPGLDKKDVKVEVKDNTLTLSGERKDERKTEGTECFRIERHYGKFERSFELPENVAHEKVSAEFKDGILTLTLPKTKKALPKQIDIAVK